MLTQKDILAALRDCYHPELPCNVLDLGLVESVSLAPDASAPGSGIAGVPARQSVRIMLLAGDLLPRDDARVPALLRNRLAAFESLSRSEVVFSADTTWDESRMTPEGRRCLARRLPSSQPHAFVQIQLPPQKP